MNSLLVFVKDLYVLIEEQSNNMKKADIQTGDWHLRDQQVIPKMSCASDSIMQPCMIDKGILDSIWEKLLNWVIQKVSSHQFQVIQEGRGNGI